jgi:hypothetical protein
MDSLPVAHGYTMRDLDQLTRIAIQRRSAYAACDIDERYAAGWHAAVDLLLTSEQPPTRRDLIHAAWESADHETRRTGEHRGHGRSRGDGSRSDGATVRFWAYWDTDSHTTPSPENGIVDRIALAQIWPQLTPGQQQALTALATMGSYQAAADAIGVNYQAFCRRIFTARSRYLALWLEGETPAGRWRDRRIQTEGGKRQSASAHMRRRRRSGAAA